MNPISIRSSCSRSTFSTSAHAIASSMRRKRQTPSSSMPRGRSVSGPHTPTSAPSFRRPQMLDRATRECRTSPTRHTLMPSIFPSLSRMVRRSSRPCVGCSCLPSPALMTLERIRLPRNSAAPDEGWRMTTMSIRIASRFLAVSTRVSPFCTALPLAATLTVSAERRFSANSNEIRVRVEASKNRLTIVLPRSAGTFLMGGADRTTGVQYVVHDHDVLAGEVPGETGLADDGLGAHRFKVVAVESDVEGAARHDHALVLLDQPGDPLGQLDAAPLDPDEHEIVGPVGELEHFHGHSLKRPRECAGVQDDRAVGPAHLGGER